MGTCMTSSSKSNVKSPNLMKFQVCIYERLMLLIQGMLQSWDLPQRVLQFLPQPQRAP